MSDHTVPAPLRVRPAGPETPAAPAGLVTATPDFRRAECAQITDPGDLAHMTPAEIVQAHHDGNLDYLLGR